MIYKGSMVKGSGGGSGGGGLQNTATGSESLTILGTPNTNSESINIGVGSEINDGYSVAVGYYASAYGDAVCIGGYDNSQPTAYTRCVAIGADAIAGNTNTGNSIAIGAGASATAGNSIAIGGSVSALVDSIVIGVGASSSANKSIVIGGSTVYGADYGIAIGDYSSVSATESIAIGANATVTSQSSIALGYYAESSQDYELVVSGIDADDNNVTYKLMDLTTGKIPNDRIDGATGSFTSQDGKTVTVTNGVITSIV